MSKQYTPEEQIERAFDVLQIKNCMARHAIYHASSRHDLEMEHCWAHINQDVSWGNNSGYQLGRDVVYGYYAGGQIGNQPEKGFSLMHCVTTPLIEIAEDGKTAQAMWYTPGYVTGDMTGGSWMYERYAIEFIKEYGEWKIWHFFVGTDFSFEAGTDINAPKGFGGPPPGAEGGAPKEEYGIIHTHMYSPDYGWSPYPPIPAPYKSIDEVVSYGPDAAKKEG